MIRKALIERIFEGFSIQRWNDMARPMDLVEMDKHGHKMALAWMIAREEEDRGRPVHWTHLVEGAIFELFRRIVIADIKATIQRDIRRRSPEVAARLDDFAIRSIAPLLPDEALRRRMAEYLKSDGDFDPAARRILDAAHALATRWEYRLLRPINGISHRIEDLDRWMERDLDPHLEIAGVRSLVTRAPQAGFGDLVAQLRFQVRWSQTPRVPRTSVLGHSMYVAVLAFLVLREMGACPRRIRNGVFGALFHDLPEALTRDIPSPIKGSDPGLQEVIGQIERALVEEQVYPLLPEAWAADLRYLIQDEFASRVRVDGGVRPASTEAIQAAYNEDRFDGYDGEVVKVCDHLAAFVEAKASLDMGIRTAHLEHGVGHLRALYRDRTLAGVDLGALYADFG